MYDERVSDAQTHYKNSMMRAFNSDEMVALLDVGTLVLWHKLLYFRSSNIIVCLSVDKRLTMELKYHSLHV